MWINALPGAQELYVGADPRRFFVPPYVGSRGWIRSAAQQAPARHVERLTLYCWTGIEEQSLLTMDPRYRIPPYRGHNGWIALDVHEVRDSAEIGALILCSYRHFALKRMLDLLEVE